MLRSTCTTRLDIVPTSTSMLRSTVWQKINSVHCVYGIHRSHAILEYFLWTESECDIRILFISYIYSKATETACDIGIFFISSIYLKVTEIAHHIRILFNSSIYLKAIFNFGRQYAILKKYIA